jgi:hypothetical protein
MNTRSLALMWVSLVGVCLSCHQARASEPIVRSVFQIATPLPSPPPEMLVYRPRTSAVSIETIGQLVRSLQLHGEIVERDGLTFVKDGDRTIEWFTGQGTGYLRYCDDERLSAQTVATNLPSEATAIELARRFLTAHGLLPDAPRGTNTGYFQFGVIGSAGGFVSEGRTALAIGFTFALDGYPVEGPGAKAGVVFGEEGKILAVSRIWRDVEPEARIPIVPVAEALAHFKANWAQEMLPDEQPSPDILVSVFANRAYLAYFARPGMLPETLLRPVYVFNGKYTVRGKGEWEAVSYVCPFQIRVDAWRQ